MEHEIPLTGGRTTAGIVRIGDTVRRPAKAISITQELLTHLESQGFSGVPRFLGIDNAGRQILTFVPGTVPSELGNFSGTQLAAAALLLRQFHDANRSFPHKGQSEVVCHGDASPCNCVFVDGIPRVFIDFDDAHPGSRLDDLGYAAWLWNDIGNDEISVEMQAHRLLYFFQSYGACANEAVPALIAAQEALAKRTNVAGVREWADNCRNWVEQNRHALVSIIAARSNKSNNYAPAAPDAASRAGF